MERKSKLPKQEFEEGSSPTSNDQRTILAKPSHNRAFTQKQHLQKFEQYDDGLSSDQYLTVSEASSSLYNEDSGKLNFAKSVGVQPDSDETWIECFCRKKGHEFFCEVDIQYIMDDFNLYDLSHYFQYFNDALYLITEMEDQNSDNELRKKDMDTQMIIKNEAQKLYGMIHQRFIQTSQGLHLMKHKLIKGEFGYCPRVLCEKQPVLPWGETDQPDVCQTRVFCPKCKGLFNPDYVKHQRLDGAYFGPNFANILQLCYPKIVNQDLVSTKKYEPKLYGFKIAKQSPMRPKPFRKESLKVKRGISQ